MVSLEPRFHKNNYKEEFGVRHAACSQGVIKLLEASVGGDNTVMCRVMMFGSAMDHMYNSGPIRL